MKKSTAALIAFITFALGGVASASPVTLSGETSLKYQRTTAEGQDAKDGTVFSFVLNAETKLSDNLNLFARFGAQHVTQADFRDFTDPNADKKSAAAIDQFGITYEHAGFTYKLGRQSLAVGTTALLYSKPETNIGKNSFVDGLTFTGKSGSVDLSGAFAHEDSRGSADNRIFAMRAGLAQDNFGYGVTLGRYQNKASGESTNHWAADASYSIGKHTLTAEFAKSSASVDNKAYAASWKYSMDDKTEVYITSFKVEAQADMGAASDFGNDQRGFYYGINREIAKNYNLEIVLKDQKTVTSGVKNTKFEAKAIYSF